MDLTTLAVFVALSLGLVILAFAVLWPGKPRSSSSVSSQASLRGRFSDVADLLESAYDHAQRQEVFGLDRRLESLKTYLSSQAAGLPLPETEADSPATPTTRKAAPRKATQARKAAPRKTRS